MMLRAVLRELDKVAAVAAVAAPPPPLRPSTAPAPASARRRDDMDAVVTWYDASDPAYVARRAAEGARRGLALDPHTAAGASDREELRYCLRSLATHAPWLRRIFLVTDAQWPSWLDEDTAARAHPPLLRVDHAALHPGGRSMYGSVAIEAVLHRIPGLSDLFLFANSDMFLTQPLARERLVRARGDRSVGVLYVDNTVTARDDLTDAARSARARDGSDWAAWFVTDVIDQFRVFERLSGQARPPEYPRASHQMQVLCRDCIEFACAREHDLWRATCDAFGRPRPTAAAELPLHIARVAYETTALWRGHCVAQRADGADGADGAVYVDAAAIGEHIDLRRMRMQTFLCVNGIEAQPRDGQERALRGLESLLPAALPYECRAVPKGRTVEAVAARLDASGALRTWSAAELARVVPAGTSSLAVVAAALERGTWREGVADLVAQLRRHVAVVLVVHNGGADAAVPPPSGADADGSVVVVAGLADGGRDFGLWARVLRAAAPCGLRRLVLANDSAFPLAHRALDALFQHPRAVAADFWGVTDATPSNGQAAHLQPYFLVAERGGAVGAVLDFLRGLDVPRLAALSRANHARECDGALSAAMAARGHAGVAVYPLDVVQGMRAARGMPPVRDASVGGWDCLVLLGCPLRRRRIVEHKGWRELLERARAADAARAAASAASVRAV